MAAKVKSDPHLEVTAVLFIDLVGYSKLLVNEQRVLFNVRMPRTFCAGLVARVRSDADPAVAGFNAARTETENILRDQPHYSEGLCLLGMSR